VTAPSVKRRERIPVRIPTRNGPYEAVILIHRALGFIGVGEAPLLPGRDASQALRAAEQCADLDLEARMAGVRMADLLGGVRRTGIECTALLTERRPRELANDVERLAAAGFRAYKLKAAGAGGQVDAERLGAVRYAAGREARLRIDFNGVLDLERAARALPTLDRFNLELAEQPLPPTARIDQWTTLAAATSVPLAADESLAEPVLADQLSKAGMGLAIKLATVGGPRAAYQLASCSGGVVTLGSSHETSIGLAAALHVACALGRQPLACGLATADFPAGDLAVGLSVLGGRLQLPDGPGLGVEIDLEALARYRTDS